MELNQKSLPKIPRKPPKFWKRNCISVGQRKKTSKIGKYFELNENLTYQNLWNAGKAVLRGKFIALNTVLERRSQISDLRFHPKQLGKEWKSMK